MVDLQGKPATLSSQRAKSFRVKLWKARTRSTAPTETKPLTGSSSFHGPCFDRLDANGFAGLRKHFGEMREELQDLALEAAKLSAGKPLMSLSTLLSLLVAGAGWDYYSMGRCLARCFIPAVTLGDVRVLIRAQRSQGKSGQDTFVFIVVRHTAFTWWLTRCCNAPWQCKIVGRP